MSFAVLLEGNKKLTRIPVTVSASCTRKKEGYHFHNYTHIWYVLAGEMRHIVEDDVFIQTPGCCVVVPPFTSHQIDLSESEDTPVVVDISFQDLFLTERGYRFFSFKNRFEDFKIPTYKKLSGKEKEFADMIMREALNEFSKKRKMSLDAIARYITDFLRILCKEHQDHTDFTIAKERMDLIMTTISYIYENLGRKITIDDLCSVSAMSRRTFTDNFKAVTGMTVVQFILTLRLSMARTLIISTNKTLSEIATDCGLYDKSRLIHLFKEATGKSPSVYREETKAITSVGIKEFDERWGWLYED